MPTPARRFPLIPVAVGGAAALVIAGAAIVLLRQQPAQPSHPQQPPQVVVQAVQPVEPKPTPTVEPKPQPPVEPQKVELEILSEPSGAAVQLEGQLLGRTPVKLPLAANAPPVMVTLLLDGFSPYTQQVSAANAPTVRVALERRAVSPRPPGKKQTLSGSSSLGIKKGR
jgi:hypothetical protein